MSEDDELPPLPSKQGHNIDNRIPMLPEKQHRMRSEEEINLSLGIKIRPPVPVPRQNLPQKKSQPPPPLPELTSFENSEQNQTLDLLKDLPVSPWPDPPASPRTDLPSLETNKSTSNTSGKTSRNIFGTTTGTSGITSGATSGMIPKASGKTFQSPKVNSTPEEPTAPTIIPPRQEPLKNCSRNGPLPSEKRNNTCDIDQVAVTDSDVKNNKNVEDRIIPKRSISPRDATLPRDCRDDQKIGIPPEEHRDGTPSKPLSSSWKVKEIKESIIDTEKHKKLKKKDLPRGAVPTPFCGNELDEIDVVNADKSPGFEKSDRVAPKPRPLEVATFPDPTISNEISPSHEEPYGAGYESDDLLSDGGELNDGDGLEFNRPSIQVLLKSIPIVPNQQHTVTERKGYLYKYTNQSVKISKLGTNWQKRWVTLDPIALKYFSSSKSYTSKRVIPVSTMANVNQDIKMSESHPFRFKLITLDKRIYNFAADTSDDMSWWTNMIMRAIIDSETNKVEDFKEGGDMHSPSLQGFVKMDGVRGRRYLAVKRGKFCVYNTHMDFKAYCPVHIVELQLANVKDIGKLKLQMYTPQVSYVLFQIKVVILPIRMNLQKADGNRFIFESQEELNNWRAAIEAGISYALGDDKILDEVGQNPCNRICADCNATGPEWAAVNFGITLCQNCAGIHRKFANAKVRSLRMDSKVWKPNLIQMMKVIGNENANAFWEFTLSDDGKIEPDCDMNKRNQFVRSKYLDKEFCDLHPSPTQQSTLNELLCKCVQTNDVLQTMRLVFSGADVNAVDDSNKTAYQLAENAGQTLQMEFLSHNGADTLQTATTDQTGSLPRPT